MNIINISKQKSLLCTVSQSSILCDFKCGFLVTHITDQNNLAHQIQIERTEDISPHGSQKVSKERNAWRCDPHSVFSRDGKWISFNARPSGGNRQVLVAYLGTEKDIQKLFRSENSSNS